MRAMTTTSADDTAQERAGAMTKRFSVNLRRKDVDRLREVSELHDVTPSEVVRRGISTEHKLVKAAEEGARIYIEWPKGRVLELDLNY